MAAEATGVEYLDLLSQEEFTEAGRRLSGGFWDAEQAAYEALWLGPRSPRAGRGQLFLLGWRVGGEVRARLALWKPHDPEEAPTEAILFFLYARDPDAQADPAFLAAAREFAAAKVPGPWIGPMAFSTWHPYRFISRMGEAVFFPGEQKMPEGWHRDFLAAGFVPVGTYQSVWVEDLAESIQVGLRLGVDRGLSSARIEALDAAGMKARLPELHGLAEVIFRDNFSFSSLDLREFALLAAGTGATEKSAGKGMDKGSAPLLLLAHVDDRPAGFAFSYDIGPYQAHAGATPRPAAVLKTLGVHPDFRARGLRSLGLGYGLSYLTHRHWLEQGCASIIHAYMKTDNRSRSMSARFGVPLRDYVLLGSEG
jgi:hypothetical protein